MSIVWQIDNLIDNGHYDGMNTGWYKPSHRNSTIPFSKRGSELYSSLKREYKEPTVTNLKDILFVRPDDSPQIIDVKIELVYEWKYVTESRKNFLIYLRKRLAFNVAKISVDATLSDLDDAYKTIMDIISKAPDMWFSQNQEEKSDDFNEDFVRNLMKNLLEFAKGLSGDEQAEAIVADLKLLTAILTQRKNAEGEFECSTYEYVNFLKDLGLDSSYIECRNCCIDTQFNNYSFCLCCGKKI